MNLSKVSVSVVNITVIREKLTIAGDEKFEFLDNEKGGPCCIGRPIKKKIFH